MNKYTIIKKETARDEIAKNDLYSSMRAATCIINACYEYHFDKKNLYESLEKELGILYSHKLIDKCINKQRLLIEYLSLSVNNLLNNTYVQDSSYQDIHQQFINMNNQFNNRRIPMEDMQ